MYRIVFQLLILLFGAWGTDDPSQYVLQRVDYAGTIKCDIETLLVLNYGNEAGEIKYPERDGFCAPMVFDVDEHQNIYFFESPWLYKFSQNKLFKEKIEPGCLDFKYFNDKIFIYKKDRIQILNSDNLKKDKDVFLPDSTINRYGVGNISFFDDHFLFLQDLEPTTLENKLKYIYDLKSGVFSNKIIDDALFNPILNCKKCDFDFLKEVFVDASPLGFLGQSKDYFCFYFACDKGPIPNGCVNAYRQFFIYNKKKLYVYMLTFGNSVNINIGAFRPFCFINDTTIMFQSLIGNRDGNYSKGCQEKLIYYKLQLSSIELNKKQGNFKRQKSVKSVHKLH